MTWTGLEPAFTYWYHDYLQTCVYFRIQPLAVRDTVYPHCQITYITHLPAFQSDFTICLQGHMVGKTGLEPATPGSQNQCSNQLNYFPIIAVF